MKRDNNVRVCSILLCGSCYLYRSTFSIWRFINRDIKKKLCPYNSTLNLFSDFYSSHIKNLYFFFYHYYFFYFKILYWFCHTSTWIHHRCTHVPNPEPPPPTSLPILSLWVIPVHQPQASCVLHWTWTSDSFHIWYYTCFNAILPNHPPLPLPQSPKDCSIHLCLFCCLVYRVIQSEVSQKEKHQYSMLTHIYGI